MAYSDVIRSAQRYNGWANYATWRVYIEIFDGYEVESAMDGEMARDMVEEIIESTAPEGLARDYAMTFLSDVNWGEIAENVNSANDIYPED